MKKTILLVLLVLVTSVALIAAAPGFEKLARLSIWNRTGATIYVQLTTNKDNGNNHYYLTIKPGFHVYTVERKIYDVTYWSCGAKTTGIADVLTQLSLTFTDCRFLHRYDYGNNATYGTTGTFKPFEMNFGEPGIEKVHNKLTKYMWIKEKKRECVVTDAAGVVTARDVAGCVWSDVWYGEYVWAARSFKSPYNPGAYWFAWRLSYDNWTARDIHWTEKWDKGTQR